MTLLRNQTHHQVFKPTAINKNQKPSVFLEGFVEVKNISTQFAGNGDIGSVAVGSKFSDKQIQLII